jgi:hypothetical protein
MGTKGRGDSKLSADRLTCAERAAKALELRKGGKTFRQIGEEMGVSEPRAFQIIDRELERLNKRRAQSAEAVTRLELERLDTMLAACGEKAKGGDLNAIDRVLKITERRAKLLGLDPGDKQPPPPQAGNQLVLNVQEMLVDRSANSQPRALEHQPTETTEVGNGECGPEVGPAEGRDSGS